ncbi:Protein argonaute-3 [Orchesella cincta]|uniref:Protein argonaute-3 n=1 Tax=Orchesella cincta TaxID=48709 RepID=A0A1D2NN32_ORCCI|nr:Protein argonaute-3 [Orchesella cincta]
MFSVAPQRGNPEQIAEPQRVLGRGRGRGRGSAVAVTVPELEPLQLSFDVSPVTLPDNPEEDDFLAAFRRLHETGSMGRGRGRGRGFPFSSCPSEDSGFASAALTGTEILTPLVRPRHEASVVSSSYPNSTVDESPDTGLEDLMEQERQAVIQRGISGKRIPVIANFVRLGVAEDMGVFEYHVDFKPEVENFRYKKQLISSLTADLGPARTFDGAKLYLATKLPNKITNFCVPYPHQPDQKVEIIIKYVKTNNLTECVHLYNVLFRRIMEHLGLVEMKRHFYNHKAVFDIPQHKLEIWPGYITAIDEYEGGLLLCCDSSFRVLRTATVLEVWSVNNQYGGAGWENNFLVDENLESSKARFKEYVVGKIMTFAKYYKDSYNLPITDLTQPMLVHRPKPKEKGFVPLILLVPEFCNITGMDASITSNYEIMKDVARHTRITPHQRNLALKKLIENVNKCVEAKSMLDMWGLTLEEAGVSLEGRVLAIPSIFSTKKEFNDRNYPGYFPDSANFGNKVLKSPIFDPVPVRNWLLLFCRHDRMRANRMMEMYKQVAQPFGIAYDSNGQAIDVGHGSTRDFHYALEKHINRQVQFVVFIFPSARDDTYSAIKRTCTTRGITSQVILSKTLGNERKLRAVMQKIALQINCKLGGSLWSIRIPLPEKIMFIGMDVYHDPKQKRPSVTALVASLNNTHTKYYSRVIFQETHQETVNSMFPILMDLMRVYADANGGYPDRIVLWRDGVGDGQLAYTKNHEVSQVTDVFKRLIINPKFTFCVVQKRINARLYLQGKFNVENPEPGTVVDHTITRKYLYDFFLVSQLVNEGTVSPTHYVVLEDNSNVSPDFIQKFAFATSFMYYNWTGSIRVPAMCQYAHKLASLVGQYTQVEPSIEMAKTLYYL